MILFRNFLILATGISIGLSLPACSNSMKDVDQLFEEHELKVETAKDVELLYSDSAMVKVRITGPTLIRNLERKDANEEFPDGVHVEFFSGPQVINSWLDARYAVRDEKNNRIIARDSVVLYNKEKDKLETSELIWDEKNKQIYTDKFVRISQPAKGDTSYGYGFTANQNFTKFEIKRKFSAKMNFDDLKSALEK